jgi:hypothetical protein
MAKYRQTVIPEASTADWVALAKQALRKKLYDEYRTRCYGKKVVNQALGITVEFEHEGARKLSYGSAIYSKKACLVSVLDRLIRYAEYSNWGDRKATDAPHIVGYLNFKAKAKIDGKIEHVHLVIRMRNTGKFHYAMEVNKVKNR